MLDTYSYRGTDIAEQVKNKFGDLGGVQITDEMILSWINNGQRDIAATSNFLQRLASTDVIANQAMYALDTLFANQRMLGYEQITLDGEPVKMLQFGDFQKRLRSDTSVEDAIGAIWENALYLWPVPVSDLADGLTIYYHAYPADLGSITDTLTVPDRFFNILIDYVHSEALEVEESFEAAAAVKQRAAIGLRGELERDTISPTAFYPTITVDPDEY